MFLKRSDLLLLTCAVLLTGCGRSESARFGAERTLPKEQRPTVWDASAKDRLRLPEMGGGAASGSETGVAAETPPGWERLDKTGPFRSATWRVAGEPDTDCYVSIGVGGGVAGNLARWYGQQFGNADVPNVEALPPVEFAGGTGRLASIRGSFQGKPAWAALIAFSGRGNEVTSLKFTGPEAVVEANRDAFLRLAKSIRLGRASPNPSAPMIQPGQPMPADHPPVGGAQTGGSAAGGSAAGGSASHATATAPASGPFLATVPVGWAPKAGSAKSLHHTFGDGGEVYVSQLGGGLKSSLDIWRGEVGLGPMSDAEFAALPKTMFLGEDAVLLDVRGTFRGMGGRQIDDARVLIAARLDGNTMTFAKLVGTAADVDVACEEFRSFCGSVRRAP